MHFISIIDYGSGNLKSVLNAFSNILSKKSVVKITSSQDDIKKSSHIVLPGVGSFESCINGLKKSKMIECIEDNVLIKKKPFLGICVGMQMLAKKGFENGSFSGLGWIDGNVKKIDTKNKNLKIPHMGWNDLEIKNKNSFLELFLRKTKQKNREFCAYFVHSYNYNLEDPNNLILSTKYGQEITAMIAKNNIIGTQFHPEKSHTFGLEFLKTFVEWKGN
tara:strand:+ start:993 stop:1649 length:657 start_codon:yes stop_codon:yes gene_type:complete